MNVGYTKIVTFTDVNTYGNNKEGEDDVYTVAEFKDLAKCKSLVDYDGYGHPVKNKKYDPDIHIKPSLINKIPKDATHIIWFNR
jgi:hypothetical protein